MPTRRLVLSGAGAICAMAAAPALGQTPERANPMPEELRRALERDPTAPVLGNPEGNITLTEFFDYNCAFCRKMVGTMQQLVAAEPDLRIVFREWPVFGPGSEFAAKASLAALGTGKYWQLHHAMLSMRGKADQASVMRAVRAVGLDEAAIRRDMQGDAPERHVTNSFLLADHMGLMGTPSFICGDELVFGVMTLAELRDLVARGRRTMGV